MWPRRSCAKQLNLVVTTVHPPGEPGTTNRESHYLSSSSPLVAIDGDPNLTLISDHGGLVLWLELLRRTHVLHDLPVRVAGAQG